MINNNKSYLNLDAKEIQKEKISDVARDAMLDAMQSFYRGKAGVQATALGNRYYA